MYWRLDQAAPRVNKGWTHRVESIPSKDRIPETSNGELEGFFSDSNDTVDKRKYYYEYNPSIVILPADQIPDIPGESPVYLASYRMSIAQWCMTREAKRLSNPKKVGLGEDFLAIAFLRADLTKIQDFVIDLSKANLRVVDYRLFTLKDQLYLTGNNLIAPVWVNLPSDMPEKKKHKIKVLRDMFKRDKNGPSLSVRTFTSCCSSKKGAPRDFRAFT
jgi:hypothetical protein